MYVSIDLGATNTRVASSKDLKSLHKKEKFSTQADSIRKQVTLLDKAISEVTQGQEVKTICLGAPGIVDPKNNKFIKLPNLPVLNNKTLEELFAVSDYKCETLLQNDAALAGLGEAVFGTGKDYDVVGYLTLSTGVGGIKISNKQINLLSNFSEPGHIIIKEGGRHSESCGQNGCLEAYVSGSAFQEIYGVSPKDCDDDKIWDEYAKHLATGIVDIFVLWDPQVLVLGGGVSNRFDTFAPLVQKHLDNLPFKLPPVVKSNLMDDAGLYGGFAYISQLSK